jgi:hypothetical protein
VAFRFLATSDRQVLSCIGLYDSVVKVNRQATPTNAYHDLPGRPSVGANLRNSPRFVQVLARRLCNLIEAT